jgi:hypothetical protein
MLTERLMIDEFVRTLILRVSAAAGRRRGRPDATGATCIA